MEEPSIPVPAAITTPVQSFDFHRAASRRGQYNETQLRREFIDPFFKVLGWDVYNNKRYSDAYKEVIHEDPIRIRETTAVIDYSFRIGGSRKFVVEATGRQIDALVDELYGLTEEEIAIVEGAGK